MRSFAFTAACAVAAMFRGEHVVVAGPVAPALARPEDQARFRLTTFGTGLAFPTSMATLSDGSLLVATSTGGTSWASHSIFASTSASIVRLVDADGDGVSDGAPQVLAAGLPGLLTSIRRVGDLVVTLSSQTGAEAVTIFRTGASPSDPLTPAGRLAFTFPSGFEHTTYALAARPAVGGGVEVYFNVGAQSNNASTPETTTVGLLASSGASFSAAFSTFQLAADSIHRVVITDNVTSLSVSPPTQIARGLRNAAGMTFDAAGNLYLEDNGIDTPSNRSVSYSADELNIVTAGQLGQSVPNFGFADTFVEYATGATIGPTFGVTAPLVAFRPIRGEKSEGAVELAVAPAAFPSEFTGGVFVAFSGAFGQGGVNNTENPVAFVDTATNTFFHFIENQVMGHPNGLLSTSDALYISDLNSTGAFYGTVDGVPADQGGVIYKIVAVPEPSALALAVLSVSGCMVAACRRLHQGRIAVR